MHNQYTCAYTPSTYMYIAPIYTINIHVYRTHINYQYIYNIRTLSVNIKFICTSFRNRQNSEPLASFSGLFRSEYKWILYLTTMYVYCVYPAMSKKSENLSDLYIDFIDFQTCMNIYMTYHIDFQTCMNIYMTYHIFLFLFIQIFNQ